MTDTIGRVRHMKKLKAFFRIVRLPNILIIILTMYMLRYGILKVFLFSGHPAMISGLAEFSLLVLVTIMLAFGGYLINDYFDIRIDAVNKPQVNTVGTTISRRSVIRAHIIVNGLAILGGFYLAWRLRSLNFGLIFPCISALLWLYSAKYKRMPAWGNLVVALLSALVIFIVWYFEFLHLRLTPFNFSQVIPELKETDRFFIVFGLFAFLITFFREIIKDLEDLEGDKEFWCRTIPIVIGSAKAKYLVTFLAALTIVLVAFVQWTFLNRGWMMVFWYFLIIIQFPLLWLIYKLSRAKQREDYHYLSNLCKLIMLAGILSVQLIATSV